MPPNNRYTPNPPPPLDPAVPFFLDPNGPYAHIGASPPPRRRRKGLALTLVSLILLVVVVGGVFLAAQGQGTDSDRLFQAALANSLGTTSFTQTTVTGSDTVTLKQDVSDNKNLRVSGTIDLTSQKTKLEGYATLANSYVKYSQIIEPDDGDFNSATAALLTNKWVQVRKDNALPANYAPETGLTGLFDPRTSVYGANVFGNFTPGDQQTLLSLAQSSAPYSFDPEAVSSVIINGQEAVQYAITINVEFLKTFNQKAGLMAGISQADLDEAIKYADFDTYAKSTITWAIGTESQRLLKVTATKGTQTNTTNTTNITTTVYTDYGTTVQSNEPSADYQYADYQQILNGSLSPASLIGKTEDTERKNDIIALATALETYHTTNSFYPSLANLNDVDWVKTNLKGISEGILLDPKATASQLVDAPTTNRYAYQVYLDNDLGACDGKACQAYKLTATYSDGSLFAKANP